MVRRDYLQRSLFTVLLPDAGDLWEPELRTIDAVLDDEAVVDLVVTALARRRPQSARRGRPGTPATVALRMLVLKHRYDWSFEECERLVRGSLVYRAFCRVDCERVPDANTLCRLAQVLGADDVLVGTCGWISSRLIKFIWLARSTCVALMCFSS